MTDLEDDQDDIRTYLARLANPIPELADVISLLCAPLQVLDLLPRNYRNTSTTSFRRAPDRWKDVVKRLPAVHSAFISHVLPVWYEYLVKDRHHHQLVLQLFAPDSNHSQHSGIVAVTAYSSLISHPIQLFSIQTLAVLVKRYPIDNIYDIILGPTSSIEPRKQIAAWEECVRCIAALPAKVSNWMGTSSNGTVPREVETVYYQQELCRRTEHLITYIGVYSVN